MLSTLNCMNLKVSLLVGIIYDDLEVEGVRCFVRLGVGFCFLYLFQV